MWGLGHIWRILIELVAGRSKRLLKVELSERPNLLCLYLLAVLGAVLKPRWTSARVLPPLEVRNAPHQLLYYTVRFSAPNKHCSFVCGHKQQLHTVPFWQNAGHACNHTAHKCCSRGQTRPGQSISHLRSAQPVLQILQSAKAAAVHTIAAVE